MRENEKDFVEFDEHNDLSPDVENKKEIVMNAEKFSYLWGDMRMRLFNHIDEVILTALNNGDYDSVLKAIQHCEQIISVVERIDEKFGFTDPDEND